MGKFLSVYMYICVTATQITASSHSLNTHVIIKKGN